MHDGRIESDVEVAALWENPIMRRVFSVDLKIKNKKKQIGFF